MTEHVQLVKYKTVSVPLTPEGHAKVTAWARACGLMKREWIIKTLNEGLKADPRLRTGSYTKKS
jgi:hypothetical protein